MKLCSCGMATRDKWLVRDAEWVHLGSLARATARPLSSLGPKARSWLELADLMRSHAMDQRN